MKGLRIILVTFITVVLLAVGALLVLAGWPRILAACCARAARRLGFEFARDPREGPTLRGLLDGVEVVVTAPRLRALAGLRTRFTIVTRGAIPGGLNLELGPQARALLGTEAEDRPLQVVTGHRDFDERITRRHAEGALIATFGYSLRLALLRMCRECRVVVENGTVVVHALRAHIDDDRLVRLVRSTVELARSLASHDGDHRDLLLHNVLNDSSPGARKRSLELLISRHPRSYAAKLALERAAADPNARVRLTAAARLGRRGVAIAEAIVRWDGESPDARAAAFEFLATRLSDVRMVPIVDLALSSRCSRLAGAAIARICKLRQTHRIGDLLRLAREAPPAIAAIALRAMGEIGEAQHERALLDSWVDGPDVVADALVHALACIGTIASVEPLHRLSERIARTNPELSEAAVGAIRRIQLRAGHLDPGRVSIASPLSDRGLLSHTVESEGCISIA